MQNPTFQASNKRGLVQRMLSDGADTFAKKVRWVKKHIPFIERPEGFVAWATRGEKRPRRNPVRLKGGEETLAFARAVADAYAAAPLYDQEAIPSYEALAKSLEKTFKQLQSKVDVRFVEGQPYSNEKEMADAVKKTGILYISTDFNEHPFFTPEQNLKFRAVHDWYTHIATGSEFSQRGEIKAYNNQAKVTPRAALPALFTEVVGQAMYATVHGDFPEQKVAILKGFDYYNVGEGPAAPKKAGMSKNPASKSKAAHLRSLIAQAEAQGVATAAGRKKFSAMKARLEKMQQLDLGTMKTQIVLQKGQHLSKTEFRSALTPLFKKLGLTPSLAVEYTQDVLRNDDAIEKVGSGAVLVVRSVKGKEIADLLREKGWLTRNPAAATHVKRGAEHLEAAEELFFSGSKSARGPAANMRRADMIAALEHAAMGKQDLMDGGDKARVIEANGIIEAVSERLQLAPARKSSKGRRNPSSYADYTNNELRREIQSLKDYIKAGPPYDSPRNRSELDAAIEEAKSRGFAAAPLISKNPKAPVNKGHKYMVKNAKGVAVYLTTTLAEARKVVPKGGCIEKL